MKVGDLVQKTVAFPKEAEDVLGVVVKLELGDFDAMYAKVCWNYPYGTFWSKGSVLEVISESR